MIDWLTSRMGETDDVVRSGVWNQLWGGMLWFGLLVAGVVGGLIASRPDPSVSIPFGLLVAGVIFLASLRLRFMSFRFGDPVEIDHFWYTERLPLESIDRFAARGKRKQLYQGYWEVCLTLRNGRVVPIPALTEDVLSKRGIDVEAGRVASERAVARLNVRLDELRLNEAGVEARHSG